MTTPQERHSARDLTKRSSTGLLLLRAELEGEAIAGTITTERRSLLGDVLAEVDRRGLQ